MTIRSEPSRRKTFAAVRALIITASMALGATTSLGATIQTSDEKKIDGTIKSFDSGNLVIQPKSEEAAAVTVPLMDVTQITFSWQERVAATPSPANTPPATSSTRPKPLSRWRVEFGNADRLTVGLGGWNDAGLSLTSETLGGGSFTIPMDQVRALWSTSDSLVKKAKDIAVKSQGQDVVYVQDKENDKTDSKVTKDTVKALACLVTGADAEFLNFKYDGKDQGTKLERVVGVVLTQREIPAEKELYQLFTLSTGEAISGRITGLDANGFRIATLAAVKNADAETLSVPIAKIDKILVQNGRIVWLGDLKPVSVTQTPYLDRLMPFRVNQSLTGGPLTMQDGVVDRGIAVHSRCFLSYDIAGGFDRFRVKVGFQQPEGKAGRAAVRVLGDDKVLWEDADLKGDAKPTVLDLPVEKIKTLRLEVDYGKDQDVGDRIIWGDARLLRTSSK